MSSLRVLGMQATRRAVGRFARAFGPPGSGGSFMATDSGSEAQTYNLVVADFNTYVVGSGKLLSQDVTDRRPTRTVVPGFLAY